ncbi:hypothetical protein TVAG_390950 [Trichomonas vaginalis G3]|uniref:Uncharacterized protein n=2 Tax=Trichomonas vaginalis (strain ATCC PRA-98 / G3) TaxID=412133 RepID=A2DFK9_TRIV3|nr:hypothetical protein TVAG_390950 [Trichomonas vaginalis G3]|eukprot:XP_001581698.1 hypothetical protein [Trichomonas vaginalis G3]
MSTENYTKIATALFPILLEAISDDCFDEGALEEILGSLITRSAFLDVDMCLRLLLFSTSEIKRKFPCLEIFSPYISIHLLLMQKTQETVAHNAHASFQQLLTYLVDPIKALNPNQATQSFIERYNKKYKRSAKTDTEVYSGLFVMLINDVTGMTLGMQPTFIDTKILPSELLYEMLEVITISTKDLITNDQNLSCLFDGTIIHLISNRDAIKFIMIFFEIMLPHTLQLFTSVLNEFISEIRPRSKSILLPIFFLHSTLLRKNISLTKMLRMSDSGESTMISLIDSLNNIILTSQPTELIDIIPKQLQMNQMSIDLSLVYCVEMLFLLISDIMVEDNAKILTFKLCKVLNNAIIVSLRYMTPKIVPIVHETLGQYLQAIKTNCEPKITHEAFKILCDRLSLSDDHRLPLSDIKLYCLEEKEKMWTPFLTNMILNNHELVEGNWVYVLNGIFASDDVQITPQFAHEYSTNIKLDIIDALLSCKHFPFDFTTNMIVNEIDIFTSIWPRLEVYFISEIASETFGENARQFFINILVKCFNKDTEDCLTKGIEKIVNRNNNVDVESLNKIFTELKNIIQMKIDLISKGWNSIFEAIHPNNAGNDPDVLSIQYSIINMICNDYISQIPEENAEIFLRTIFRFARQEIDINVSLSSMDLIWTVKRTLTNTQRWSLIFKSIVNVFDDPRIVLATSSVTTLFNLLSSNINDVSDENFKELFQVFLMSVFERMRDNFTSVRQQILNEVSHFFCGFWARCEKLENYYEKILPTVIKSETMFATECKNVELVSGSFDFYQTFFSCPDLTEQAYLMLIDSLTTLIKSYKSISDAKNLVLSVFGRTIGRCLERSGPSLNENKYSSKSWAKLLELCAAVFMSDKMVHIVLSHFIQAIEKIFPLITGQFEPLIISLSEVFLGTSNKPLRDLCVSTLIKTFGKSDHAQQLTFFTLCGKVAVYDDAKELRDVLSTLLSNSADSNEQYRFNVVLESDDKKLLEKITEVDAEGQKEFVRVKCAKEMSTLVEFYGRFINKENKDKFPNILENCLDTFVEMIKEIDLSCRNDAQAKQFMDFIDNLDENDENDKKILLATFYPCISLVTSSDSSLRSRVQETLRRVGKTANI